MTATDVAPNRLTAARRAAAQFAASVPGKVNIGVMAFNQIPQVLQSPTRDRAAVNARSHGWPRPAAPPSATRSARRPTSSSGSPARLRSARRPRSCCSPTALPRAAATRSPPRARPPASCTSRSTRSRSAPRSGTITVPRRAAGRGQRRPSACRPTRRRSREIARASGGQAFTANERRGLERGLRAARRRSSDTRTRSGRSIRRVRRRRPGCCCWAAPRCRLASFGRIV